MGLVHLLSSYKNSYLDGYDLYGRSIFARWLSTTCGPVRPLKVLDLGCGKGDDLATVKRIFPQASLTGIELPGYVDPTLSSLGISTVSLNLDSDSLLLTDGSFDLVLANQVFEHLKNWAWMLRESARVLRKGGLLFIGVPNIASLHNRILMLFGHQPTCMKPASMHIRGFTLKALRQVVVHQGVFRVKAKAGAGFYPFPPVVARGLCRLFPGAAVTIFLACEKVGHHSGFDDLEAIARVQELRG